MIMNKTHFIKSIERYNSAFEQEDNFKQEFLELLKDENCFLRSRLAGHLTASCWVMDAAKERVLLMHHKKLYKWLQPGGHADGDKDLLNVAKKELTEETGLTHYSVSSEIFDLDIHTIPERKEVPEHLHYDVRFLFVAGKPEEIQKNNESIDLKWVGFDEVYELCGGEESIMRMVDKSCR